MHVVPLAIAAVKLVTPKRFGDHRGYFAETWSRRAFAAAGLDVDFVQDNHSLSRDKGTIRGLHFQLPPRAQAKLVRVVAGAILDVAVDLRRSSPTFGKHVTATLSAEEGACLFLPAGFAHGFATLEPDTEVIYKVSDVYAPDLDRGLAFDDPDLAIEWPVGAEQAIVSDKDRRQPRLAQLGPVFE